MDDCCGAGYALITKEAYHGEHDEVIKSIVAIDGLSGFVEDLANIMLGVKDNEKQRALALPVWVISHINPTSATGPRFQKNLA